MVDTPERLAEFKRVYRIPRDVEVRYCPESKVIFSRGEGKVIISLVAFVKGIRIHMSRLLTNFLRHFKVCPDQCTPNAFRLVSCVDELNKWLSYSLTEHDINYVYSFQVSKTFGFYFKIRHGEVRLISGLLDFDKEIKGDYLISRGIGVPMESNVLHLQVEQVGRNSRIFLYIFT